MLLRRRLLGVVLAGITLLLMATGVPAATVPVSVLMPASFADASAPLVREFNASHPGIRLEVTRGPLDTESVSDLAISSLLLGSSPYDLLLMDVTWTPKYVAVGWLEPLEGWLGDDAMASIAPGADLGNAFDGHLWRFPMVASMGLLYWRTDLMPAPPRTPTELTQISRELQSKGAVRWGYVWQGRQYEGLSTVFLEMLRGFGGRWIVDGSPTLNSKDAVAATRWLDGLIRQGVSPPTVVTMAEPESLQVFAAGQAAFMRNWPYAWRSSTAPAAPWPARWASPRWCQNQASPMRQPRAAGDWPSPRAANTSALPSKPCSSSPTKTAKRSSTKTLATPQRAKRCSAIPSWWPPTPSYLSWRQPWPMPCFAPHSGLCADQRPALPRTQPGVHRPGEPRAGMEQLQEQTLQLRRTAGGAI